ncbi:unnamed protein product [Blepharisma stoltei]|uniref:Uncharacterized protein n=1 Tax=Blepharisma stoltei TaxID=1481888 RepID=A0AAU9IE20_9CILI|nr:unnamed protein product [Blepharisma stoltei]
MSRNNSQNEETGGYKTIKVDEQQRMRLSAFINRNKPTSSIKKRQLSYQENLVKIPEPEEAEIVNLNASLKELDNKLSSIKTKVDVIHEESQNRSESPLPSRSKNLSSSPIPWGTDRLHIHRRSEKSYITPKKSENDPYMNAKVNLLLREMETKLESLREIEFDLDKRKQTLNIRERELENEIKYRESQNLLKIRNMENFLVKKFTELDLKEQEIVKREKEIAYFNKGNENKSFYRDQKEELEKFECQLKVTALELEKRILEIIRKEKELIEKDEYLTEKERRLKIKEKNMAFHAGVKPEVDDKSRNDICQGILKEIIAEIALKDLEKQFDDFSKKSKAKELEFEISKKQMIQENEQLKLSLRMKEEEIANLVTSKSDEENEAEIVNNSKLKQLEEELEKINLKEIELAQREQKHEEEFNFRMEKLNSLEESLASQKEQFLKKQTDFNSQFEELHRQEEFLTARFAELQDAEERLSKNKKKYITEWNDMATRFESIHSLDTPKNGYKETFENYMSLNDPDKQNFESLHFQVSENLGQFGSVNLENFESVQEEIYKEDEKEEIQELPKETLKSPGHESNGSFEYDSVDDANFESLKMNFAEEYKKRQMKILSECEEISRERKLLSDKLSSFLKI